MSLKRSSESFLYEEELRDLLTYDCPISGKKRCPPSPVRKENIHLDKTHVLV